MESSGAVTGVPRSHLYVPADQPERLAKVLTRGADGIILDLEDAVAADRKEFIPCENNVDLRAFPSSSCL